MIDRIFLFRMPSVPSSDWSRLVLNLVCFICPSDTQLQMGNQMPQLTPSSPQQQQRQQQQQQQQATGSPQQQQQQQHITQQLLAQSVPQRTLLPQNYVTQLGQVRSKHY